MKSIEAFIICAKAIVVVAVALVFSGIGTPATALDPNEPQLDICYYDRNGNQHDADWCRVGSDISIAGNVNLDPHCFRDAGAVCQLGNYGDCQPNSKLHNRYVIFPSRSGRCPTSYAQAIAGRATGGPQTVTPNCPAGHSFQGGQCVRSAAPAPSCPPGFVFSQGQCLRSATSAPPPPSLVAALFPREVQANLFGLGCLRGGVDGVWGPASIAALQRFAAQKNSGLPPGFSQPTQAAFDATNRSSAPSCPLDYAAPPPVYNPSPPATPQVRCSQVKFGFTRGNTCACTDNRIFNGTACVRPQQTGGGGGGQLPSCPNAVNGICERQAFTECDGVQPQVKFDQCFASATRSCERQNGCWN